jgi:hypothetical protein
LALLYHIAIRCVLYSRRCAICAHFIIKALNFQHILRSCSPMFKSGWEFL